MNRWMSSLCGILLGCAFCVPPSLLLLYIYGVCLIDPRRPDYHAAKLRVMFDMSESGFLTWIGVVGVLLGISLAIVGGMRPLLGRQPARLANTWREDILAAREMFGPTSTQRTDDERTTLAPSEDECELDPNQDEVSKGQKGIRNR